MKELLVGLTSKDVQNTVGFKKVEADSHAIEGLQMDLEQTVYGQSEAMNQLARAVTRSFAGYSDPNRPEGVFMFLGPTGTGKTEAGKALARTLYGNKWENKFLRIDCTQLQEPHSVGRLKGSEPSYVGYGDNNILITPEFLHKGGVIVFDEVEKAHPTIWRWLLPVMEEGQQKALVPTGGAGRGYSSELATLNFADTYLIFTANIGAEKLHKAKQGDMGIGFHHSTSRPDLRQIGMSELKKEFAQMPEFLGRLDSTVVFNELSHDSYVKIFNKFMDEINNDQKRGSNYLAATEEVREFVLSKAETGEYGAREIRHKLNQHLLDTASEIKFSGVLKEGEPLIAYDVEDEKVQFATLDLPNTPATNEQEDMEENIFSGVSPEDMDKLRQEIAEIDEDMPIQSQREKKDNLLVPGKKVSPDVDLGKKGPKFYIGNWPPDGTIDLAIKIKTQNGEEYAQAFENMPLIKV